MIDSVMLWNEPNNKSHWDPAVDPEWVRFGEMVARAGRAIRAANPNLPRVLGGMSPIEALKAGTIAAAQSLGMDKDIGSL